MKTVELNLELLASIVTLILFENLMSFDMVQILQLLPEFLHKSKRYSFFACGIQKSVQACDRRMLELSFVFFT